MGPFAIKDRIAGRTQRALFFGQFRKVGSQARDCVPGRNAALAQKGVDQRVADCVPLVWTQQQAVVHPLSQPATGLRRRCVQRGGDG